MLPRPLLKDKNHYPGHRCPKCDGPLYFDMDIYQNVTPKLRKVWVWCVKLGRNMENSPLEYRPECDWMGWSDEL